MKSGKNYLILLFALLAVVGGAIAWNLNLANIDLTARVANPGEHADLRKRVAELEEQNKGLQAQIGALQEQIATLTAQAQETADQKKMTDLLPGASPPPVSVAAPGLAGQPAAQVVPPTATSAQRRALVEQRYADLVNKLNLNPDQAEEFKNLIATKMQAASDAANALLPTDPAARPNLNVIRQTVANIETNAVAQIQAQFGDAAATQYQQYQQTFGQRNTVGQLASMLGNSQTPLTDDQAAQMVQVLTQTAPPMPKGSLGTILDGGMSYHSRITPQTINAATGFLTPEQVAALQRLQKQQ
jgi:septal ring factor EnvC (AmiA/AmiB activator)